MGKTSIEWTRGEDGTEGVTWNPIRGCSRVSPGCDNCFAMFIAHRFSGPGKPFEGLTTIRRGKPDWAGTARFIPGMLATPLRWRKPRRVFVNSMTDLFHESLTNEEIAAVFGAMTACPHHTFQILTKRPKRAAEWFKWVEAQGMKDTDEDLEPGWKIAAFCNGAFTKTARWRVDSSHEHLSNRGVNEWTWPLPNVHLGVSAENQETWDARKSFVHTCPAAVHWASLEPLLGPIELGSTGEFHLDWCVIGGEAGRGSRPMDIAWARSLIEQCRQAGIPVFTKQLGGNHFAPWKVRWDERLDGSFDAFSIDRVGVKGTNLATVWPNGVWHTWDANGIGGENAQEASVDDAKREALVALQSQHVQPVKGWARHKHMLRHRKGGDITEWPEDLRVREFPKGSA